MTTTTLPAGYRLVSGSIEVDPSAPASALPAGYVLECRLTADGERFPRLIPPPALVQDVLPGGTCGVRNDNGALLQCVTGSSCLKAASGEPGICQPFAKAPISGG